MNSIRIINSFGDDPFFINLTHSVNQSIFYIYSKDTKNDRIKTGNTLMKPTETIQFQIIWGVLLILAGIGVFYRIPQVMPRLADLEIFTSIIPFIKFCFYLIGIILFGGGIQKVYKNISKIKEEKTEE